MRQKDIRPAPARIDFKGMKFLITDRPSDANMQTYLMVSKLVVKFKNHGGDIKTRFQTTGSSCYVFWHQNLIGMLSVLSIKETSKIKFCRQKNLLRVRPWN